MPKTKKEIQMEKDHYDWNQEIDGDADTLKREIIAELCVEISRDSVTQKDYTNFINNKLVLLKCLDNLVVITEGKEATEHNRQQIADVAGISRETIKECENKAKRFLMWKKPHLLKDLMEQLYDLKNPKYAACF